MSGKFALVIGNNEYQDARLAQLTAPGKDAQDLARVLRDADFCAFDDVRVLVNEPEPVVREAIDEFFDAKTPDDLLLLYFSGHGVKDELGALYLAVKNTSRARLRSTAIKSDFIQEAMEESRARRQVLILDCCNSGAFQQGTKAATGGSIGIGNAFGGTGRVILTASDSLQYAWQGDAVMGNTENSLFTHFLVEGLKGEAETDGDGVITVDELYDYTYDQVRRATPNQTPSKFASRQEGEIVLRQITRIQDIKPISLPDDLQEAISDSRTFVRLGAVEELAKLLQGKNLGLARSAREALDALCAQDDSLSVRKAAGDALASILAAEKEAAAQVEQQKAESALPAQQETEGRLRQTAKAEAASIAQPNIERDAAKPVKPGEIKETVRDLEAAHAMFARQELSSLGKVLKRRPAAQEPAAAQPRRAPGWLSVLWIALGFVLSSWLSNQLPFGVTVNVAIYGMLAGLTVAVVLYLGRTLRQWKSIAWIMVGWALAWTISGFFAQYLTDINWNYSFSNRLVLVAGMSGGVAGAALALVLFLEDVISRWQYALAMMVAWGLGGVIDGVSLQVLYSAYFSSNDPGFAGAVLSGAVLDAAVGAAIMIWLLRRLAANAPG